MGITLLIGLLATLSSAAQAESPVVAINADAAKSPVVAHPLRKGVSVLTGSGGNIGVLSDSEGQFLVDAGIAVSRARITEALKGSGPGRPRYVVNTHYHWDHTDGNVWLHQTGATVIAHPNTVRHLMSSVRVDDWDWTFPPAPAAALAKIQVSDTRTITFGGETIVIQAYGRAHTDGDLSVYFRSADVLFTGDTWWNGYYPFIDRESGGSIDGMIRAAEDNLARSAPTTLIVPGHGPVGSQAELREFHDMLVSIRDSVAHLKQKGASVSSVIAAKPSAPFDAKWGQYVIDPAFFTRLVYETLP